MNKVLLDTDIVINLLKKDEEFVSKFLKLVKDDTKFYYNPIVLAEVYAGAFEKEIKTIEQFFDKLDNIEICKYTGVQAGKYANSYKKAYNKISLEDYLIAACAKINGLTLWTNNKKHYPMDDIKLLK
jgi:predicted nucleic acid-binding protein